MIDIKTPSGRHYRWADDEPDAAVIPADLSFATTMPGGFGDMSCTLPRKTTVTYQDLDRLSTISVTGAGGEPVWEGRLEGTPRVSGAQMAVSPGAVGWQAHLEDDKSAKVIYVDRDLSRWGPMSVTYNSALRAFGVNPVDGEVGSDPLTGLPKLHTAMEGNGSVIQQYCFLVYDAGVGNAIGSIDYAVVRGTNVSAFFDSRVATDDIDTFTSVTQTSNLAASSGSIATLTAGTNERFARVSLLTPGGGGANAGGVNGTPYAMTFVTVVWGDHGLTHRTDGTDTGLFAGDVIRHALANFAPLLKTTAESVGNPGFVIPQLAFLENTTAAEIVSACNRYSLWDWAIWEDKTFWFHDRGARGRKWRARIAPSELSETGPSMDRLWNGILVRYNDVDGTSRTVGPTGSDADTTSAYLLDADPQNPANQLGIRRWDLLEMSGVSTAAGAIEVGRRFLEQSKTLDSSGQAQLVGFVEDDRGIRRPAWQVRAGDTIRFVDAADASERRIVKTSYSHSERTCSVDLDAPPDALASLLERLQAVLVPLGL